MSIIVSTLTRERVSWQITPRVLTEALAASGDEAKRAFDAMMGMKKIDVAAIKAARLRCVAGRWFAGLERPWEGRGWIACADFTALTFFFATVVREVRKTDLTDAYPRLKAYYARGFARPGSAPSASTQSG